eukprot:CAMPEP_0197308618 /NCGR_PEP_ID=MMETSP0891-20130614/7056_1 /TAXON_ID=44058 ORGANISM="Aureoumbra lagunensis, Strain CCMP1510" /NCGR_SAMPLE_ID=MMETSP0891 /ASSEMBLY_ACC=CAM_ASM_000534 /LENGTH=267 /DNA_ID=CAMNT_0042793155 /DNA_START=106 /DNA_END=909 /DNA_ORIENTATION=-
MTNSDTAMRAALNNEKNVDALPVEDYRSCRKISHRPKDNLIIQQEDNTDEFLIKTGRRQFNSQQQQQQKQDEKYAQSMRSSGRRLFCTGKNAEPGQLSELEKFAHWYRTEYNEEPSRETLEHAAKRIIADTSSQQDAVTRIEEEEDEQNLSKYQSKPLSSSLSQAEQDFILWYREKYGSEPPPKLIARAALTFLPDNHPQDQISQPKPLHHTLGISSEEELKHRGPRAGPIGYDSDQKFSKNTILGRSSTRVANPPGGQSSLSLNWD